MTDGQTDGGVHNIPSVGIKKIWAMSSCLCQQQRPAHPHHILSSFAESGYCSMYHYRN